MPDALPKFCAKCFEGTLRGDVEPAGSVETIHGLPTYVARPAPPAEPVGIVVIAPDAFGWEFRNMRALADAYAQRIPAVVLLPDLMQGNAFPLEILALSDEIASQSTSFLRRTFILHPKRIALTAIHYLPFLTSLRPSAITSRLGAYLANLKSQPPPPFARASQLPDGAGSSAADGEEQPPKIGLAGFCWGGKYALLLSHPFSLPSIGANLVDASFTAHPSLVSVPADLNPIVVPLSLAIGTTDEWMSASDIQECKRLLEAKSDCEVRLYEGATHGFAVRGNPHDEKQARFGLQAEDQAVAWFRQHLGPDLVARRPE